MQLGMIGLGRMGANMVRRLMRDGHACVVYDVNRASVEEIEKEGAVGAASLEDLVAKLTKPRSFPHRMYLRVSGVLSRRSMLFDSFSLVIDVAAVLVAIIRAMAN